MRRLLLTISPLALLLAFSAPSTAQNGGPDRGSTDKTIDRPDHDRGFSRDRSGSDRSGGRAEARDSNGSGRQDRADTGSRDRDVTGAIGDHDHDHDHDHDRGRGHDRDHDHDRGGWGGRGHDHDRARDNSNHDHTDSVDRAWVHGETFNSNAAFLQQLIDENRAEIAQAYQQYQLTRDRQTRNYLRQLIGARQAQNQRLQAQLNR